MEKQVKVVLLEDVNTLLKLLEEKYEIQCYSGFEPLPFTPKVFEATMTISTIAQE